MLPKLVGNYFIVLLAGPDFRVVGRAGFYGWPISRLTATSVLAYQTIQQHAAD